MMKKDRVKRNCIILASIMMMAGTPMAAFAQDEATVEAPAKDKKPVRSPFESTTLIESQSYVVFPKKTLMFNIQHRFGNLNSNTFDLFGLYAPSNIRMGLSYTVINNLQIGIGTTKNSKLQDLNWKYAILTQTRSNSMPIAMTYFGTADYSANEEESFGLEYKGSHRISYFNQLIIGRKFNDRITVQIMANYAHFNQIDTAGMPDLKHDNFGVGIAGRFKFSPQTSFVLEYEQPLTTPETVMPNLSIAFEIATSAHAFQLFITTYNSISYQRNLVYNTNDFANGDFLIGFNITRNWSF